ncbi:MAG: UMP kinase [Candidatus Altiarchaeota archaeon]
MKLVFSFGGSVIAPDKVDAEYVQKLSSFLEKLLENHSIAVVVGGGQPARRRIAKVRDSGASEAECDYEGILATRENAGVLLKAMGDKAFGIPETLKGAADSFSGDRVLVMGGTEPGHSTDAVAALLAEWVKADMFLNASNVDAVYDKNPKQFKDAKPLKTITITELTRLLDNEGVNAGEYPLLDPVALKIIRRSSIRTIILDGRDLDNIGMCIEGSGFSGTTVTT